MPLSPSFRPSLAMQYYCNCIALSNATRSTSSCLRCWS